MDIMFLKKQLGIILRKETVWELIQKSARFQRTLILTYVQSMWKIILFNSWKKLGHIPRETYRHVYYFIKAEGSIVNGSVISTKYRPSPIQSGGLKILLLLRFSCPQQKTFEKMKNFVDSLYDYEKSRVNDAENSDEEEACNCRWNWSVKTNKSIGMWWVKTGQLHRQ